MKVSQFSPINEILLVISSWKSHCVSYQFSFILTTPDYLWLVPWLKFGFVNSTPKWDCFKLVIYSNSFKICKMFLYIYILLSLLNIGNLYTNYIRWFFIAVVHVWYVHFLRTWILNSCNKYFWDQVPLKVIYELYDEPFLLGFFLSWNRCKTQLIHGWEKYSITKNLFFFRCTGLFLHRESKGRVKSNMEIKNTRSGKHWALYLKQITRAERYDIFMLPSTLQWQKNFYIWSLFYISFLNLFKLDINSIKTDSNDDDDEDFPFGSPQSEIARKGFNEIITL